MKTEMTLASTSTGYSNSQMSIGSKYNGLIQQSPIKTIRNRLYILLGYIDSSGPTLFTLHSVMTFFRFLQFLGPCLVVACPNFWEFKSLPHRVASYISILFHIVPAGYRASAGIYIEFVYSIIVIFYFVLLVVSSISYQKTSKLPNFVVYLVSIMNASIMHVIHPIGLQMSFQTLSRLFMGLPLNHNAIAEIIALCLTIVCAFGYAFLFLKVMSITLVFRPNSMLTTAHKPQFYFILSTYIITMLSAVSTYLPTIPFVVLNALCSITMFASICIVFMAGSFVRTNDSRLVLSSCITGGITFLFNAIYSLLGQKASMVTLFVFFAIFAVSVLVSNLIISAHEHHCLKVIDKISDDPTIIDDMRSPANLIRVACVGFKYAHPICVDWSIFRNASERWPESAELWAMFGKFVAIYPEENKLLSYIIHNIESKKIKGGIAKQTVAQGKIILTERETTLSPELKKKLQHVGKSVQNAKRKLRHIWDLVIQGNTHEMEGSVNNAYTSVLKTQAEFSHVLSQYPNNRFIARAYLRFLQEILADHKGFAEWVEKVKILQRGISATVDHTNVLGIAAYPHLPPVIQNKTDTTGMQTTIETESTILIDVDLDDDNVIQANEAMAGIRDQIRSLTIPVLRTITVMSLVVFLLFILTPIVVIFVYAPTFINSLEDPLQFMYYLSGLRCLNYQVAAFAFHWVFENYPKANPPFIMPDYSDISTTSFGNFTTTLEQLKYLNKVLAVNLEAIGKYRSYESENTILEPARERTYKSTLQFKFFDVNGDSKIINVSIQSGLMDYTLQLSKLSQVEELTPQIIQSNLLMNSVANVESIGQASSEAIDAIIEYLGYINDNMKSQMTIVLIVLIVVFCLFYIILIVLEIRALKSNKNEIFKCLTSLPKNVVSGMAESLRILKKDATSESSKTVDPESDVSKQEENILKIFASAGDSSSSVSSDNMIYIVSNLVFLAVDIVITYMFTNMFMTVTKNLRQNGPQLDYVMGSPAYLMAAVNILNMASVGYQGLFNYTSDPYTTLNSMQARIEELILYYHQARYGGSSADDPPFINFDEINLQAEEQFMCADENSIPTDLRSVYTCLNADQQTTLFESVSQKIALPVLTNQTTDFETNGELYTELWYMTAVLLYESFFHPMFTSILPGLRSTIDSAIPDTLPTVIIFAVVSFLFVIILNSMVANDAAKLKFALNLLLHCPVNVVMSSQKINEILGGNFTDRFKDATTRSHEFFNEVVSHLPDSIIVVNNQFQVVSVNKSTERIYDITADELINTDVHDFLQSSKFSKNVLKIIGLANKNKPIETEYKLDDGTTYYLELTCMSFNQSYVITTRDRTQVFNYNTLIQEEKAKSDKLLASILPPSLVERVQNGEKNISFAVQSASILFLDIVEFTPWCASNTASMVMSTLNQLFKLLDTKLATHPNLTKIKCIGDCYMAAGGIFSEVNQPTVHAKEMVEFGLESLDCVTLLNSQINQSLRIRVGINTGGPIVAGVLGTEKPTFEILGPTINMAQQMEHHGVPMKVHISRSVYELIYGGNFVIKERGQIEIKSGKVITYLVTDKDAGSAK
ncbi:Adenylate and Guanylate cyclase catalytic domain containing protein [Tritrichomonas foetus]|uniref:Adenylate and Guanylate cyclase catalytic domain containing protein n=1 Tax=Tritrichomonas foetus TaxID=1144522 RepID=A0A1J4KSF2_9EUKA|nr:Adenylate and Guanylate cyclase catalytic domain containing protein [Tritrichomonas foetus]|eukprot:OHT13816.1 Adenylate and Guanylate cyclase catalytic domain containing protein [Tritrichomonas foetus]